MKISHTFEHGPHHEELLESSLTADRPVLHPDLADCPRCREEFQELSATMRLLEGAAQEEHAALVRTAAQPAGEAPPGAELVEPFFRARFAERQRRPLVRGKQLALRWAAAAAALVTVSWGLKQYLNRSEPGEAADRVLLSSASSSVLWPRGPGSSFEIFSWDAVQAPPGGWFELEITDSATHEVLFRSGKLERHSWSPEHRAAQAWPEDITWTLRVLDGTGDEAQTLSARANRH